MITTATNMKTAETLVGMGQIVSDAAGTRMKAIVGSCIALVLYHPKLKTGAMAHVVLPDSAGRGGTPGKFADTAVPAMLTELAKRGAPANGLTARLAGGANMFGNVGPLRIGEANAEALAAALRAAGIPVAAQDVGGAQGRRVTFDCASGTVTVERAGEPARTL